ncbi:response regulator transcription factor [Paenibacillus sp. MBLB4367]|uniref:response regulator transcription factor n=1 Tax=Paenibacillus sp. MBLB4367 TaxID=3384767 RepID=UPI0039082BCB
MGHTILVADDEANMTEIVAKYLEREGYRVVVAADGEAAIRLWRQENPDLVVLDVMMPGVDGWQVCEEIRNEQEIPILMLTARGEEIDRLMGLTMGADDYMTKPFSPRELVLRVKAILRRYYRPLKSETAEAAAHLLLYEGIEINTRTRQVAVNGQTVELTVKEFELLALFAGHPEQVFSRNQLLNRIWNTDYYGDTTTVTVHIRRLREKIEPVPSQPRYIKTVWGIGYKFDGGERV